jgi:hypothetical protein
MKVWKVIASSACISFSAFAQNVPVDFEPGGHGANWTWTVFENENNPPLEIVANPDQNSPNTSSTVAKFTAKQGGQPWAGTETEHGEDIGSFILDSTTSTIKILVWKSVISDVGIKLVESSAASLGEIKVANTLINQWEELEFDFSTMEGIEYDQIVIFPDFDLGGRTSDNICYFDNITFGSIMPLPSPMVDAPDPLFDSIDVKSIYSDSYDDVTIDTFITAWSNASLEFLDIQDNPTLLYRDLSFAGLECTGPNLLDLDSMDSLHVNIWSPNFSELRIKLVDFGPDQAYDGGDDTEHEMTFSAPNTEEWITYDIALDSFSSLANRNNIAQIILSADPSGSANVYVDNLLFYRESTSLTDSVPVDTIPEDSTVGFTQSSAKSQDVNLFPNPTSTKIFVQTNLTIISIEISNISGQVMEVERGDFSVLDLDSLDDGTYYIVIETTTGVVRKAIVKQSRSF